MTVVPPSEERAQWRRANLSQDVSQYIRDLVLSGKIRPGDRIDQDAIALQLGVSRLPVREALIALESEGLVEHQARRGSFVAPLTPDDITDHFHMYGLLSGIAAARAARHASVELIEQLAKTNLEMRDTARREELDELNFQFHQAINRAGSSGRLRAVLRTLSRSMPTSFIADTSDPRWRKSVVKEHDLILQCIRSGDEKGAAEAVATHFMHTGEQAVKMLRAQGFWSGGA